AIPVGAGTKYAGVGDGGQTIIVGVSQPRLCCLKVFLATDVVGFLLPIFAFAPSLVVGGLVLGRQVAIFIRVRVVDLPSLGDALGSIFQASFDGFRHFVVSV